MEFDIFMCIQIDYLSEIQMGMKIFGFWSLVRDVPVLVGTDLQFPGPCSWMYDTKMMSSSGVQGPFLIPTLSQQGGLPMTSVNYHLPHPLLSL